MYLYIYIYTLKRGTHVLSFFPGIYIIIVTHTYTNTLAHLHTRARIMHAFMYVRVTSHSAEGFVYKYICMYKCYKGETEINSEMRKKGAKGAAAAILFRERTRCDGHCN